MSCQNNLKQLGLALHNYQAALGVYPPSTIVFGGATNQPWSTQAFLLPYVEQNTIESSIDYSIGYHHGSNQGQFPPNGVAAVRVPVLMCPSETKDGRVWPPTAPRSTTP